MTSAYQRLAAYITNLPPPLRIIKRSLSTLQTVSHHPYIDYSMSEDRSTKFPLQGLTDDGWSNEDEATATCACGAVQMVIVRLSVVLAIQSSS
jgi:hypothetical protein